MYERMQSEYKLVNHIREYLEFNCDCMTPVEGVDCRERDYKRLLDVPKVIEAYREENKKLAEENQNLRFMNAELVKMVGCDASIQITADFKVLRDDFIDKMKS